MDEFLPHCNRNKTFSLCQTPKQEGSCGEIQKVTRMWHHLSFHLRSSCERPDCIAAVPLTSPPSAWDWWPPGIDTFRPSIWPWPGAKKLCCLLSASCGPALSCLTCQAGMLLCTWLVVGGQQQSLWIPTCSEAGHTAASSPLSA